MPDNRFCLTCDTLNTFLGFDGYNTVPKPCKQCGSISYSQKPRPHSTGTATLLTRKDIEYLKTERILPDGLMPDHQKDDGA